VHDVQTPGVSLFGSPKPLITHRSLVVKLESEACGAHESLEELHGSFSLQAQLLPTATTTVPQSAWAKSAATEPLDVEHVIGCHQKCGAGPEVYYHVRQVSQLCSMHSSNLE
jgi:hypothetical protein